MGLSYEMINFMGIVAILYACSQVIMEGARRGFDYDDEDYDDEE